MLYPFDSGEKWKMGEWGRIRLSLIGERENERGKFMWGKIDRRHNICTLCYLV